MPLLEVIQKYTITVYRKRRVRICGIAVIQLYVYTYIWGNIINNYDERTHFFRKIYLSHFMRKSCERVVCERWVGNRTDCNILTPTSSVFSSTSFSFCWAAQPGVRKAQALCWELVLTVSNCNSNFNCNWLQLTQAVCITRLYNYLTSTCFLWAPQLHWIQLVKVIPRYLRPDAPISWLTADSKVNMLQIVGPLPFPRVGASGGVMVNKLD